MAGRRSINEGTRLTRQRQAVLNSFSEDHQHLSAEEVYQRVKGVQPRISLATVYRNLELLTRLGLLQQFSLADGTRRYELASHHHHHLVCIDCGGA
ncbi:MAG: transcriptional repressor [Syntrophomonadaceae bacterium]|nr:transcriptional repressor [Syntrophomonadaceae bacterium]